MRRKSRTTKFVTLETTTDEIEERMFANMDHATQCNMIQSVFGSLGWFKQDNRWFSAGNGVVRRTNGVFELHDRDVPTSGESRCRKWCTLHELFERSKHGRREVTAQSDI